MVARTLILLFLISAALAACTARPPQDPGADIEAYLAAKTEAGEFSGAVLVARAGDILLRGGFGLADREAGVPNTPETRYRVHMVTMQFTALAVLMLEAEGRLAVEDPVCRHLPDCPAEWEGLTLHHLLTHTAGISDGIRPWEGPEPPTTALEKVALLKDHPPYFAPGEGFRYSTNGYLLLGAVIEQVARRPYLRFLEERIFEPLGMDATGFADQPLAAGYRQNGGRAPASDNLFRFSASGLSSTVDDLYRWDQALYEAAFVPPAVIDRMMGGYALTPSMDFPGAEYGYGWFTGTLYDRPVQFHGGGELSGFFAMLMRFPEERVTIIVLRNVEVSIYDRLEIELAGLVFGEQAAENGR